MSTTYNVGEFRIDENILLRVVKTSETKEFAKYDFGTLHNFSKQYVEHVQKVLENTVWDFGP